MSRRTPGVVAELDRPETPAETAARKAEDRRLRRARQTTRNLVASLGACVLVVLAIVAFVPRGADTSRAAPVDVAHAAAGGQGSEADPLLTPSVPGSWSANAAQIRTTAGIDAWYVGYVLPDDGFAAFSQGFRANPSWLDATLTGAHPTGATTIAGHRWVVYDQRAQGADAGNVAYALSTSIRHSTIAVYGTASPASMRRLAAAIAADAQTWK